MPSHRLTQTAVERHHGRVCRGARRGCRQVPVLLGVQAPPFDNDQLRRLELADSAVHRPRRGHVSQREIRVNRGGAPFASHAGIMEKRAKLRGEDNPVAGQEGEIQRPDAHVVAREHQPPIRLVPDRTGEGSVQTLHAARAPLLVGMGDQLAVSVAAERVTAALQLGPQPGGIADRGMGDCPNAVALVRADDRRRLISRRPRPTERDAGRDEHAAAVVGALHGVEHPFEDGTHERLVRFEAQLADDTAHVASVEQARCQ